ncbi:hypothetical protein EYF80_044637 [Liparis tanakae]|uniref:Uncharacterized protein n=1 Tax=Liparis tanakae TaxID=230148 RepID=A0A4Z2FW09_9TELE|nr:hypothetical protein EYF80_044637 [Liparis tanakae]
MAAGSLSLMLTGNDCEPCRRQRGHSSTDSCPSRSTHSQEMPRQRGTVVVTVNLEIGFSVCRLHELCSVRVDVLTKGYLWCGLVVKGNHRIDWDLTSRYYTSSSGFNGSVQLLSRCVITLLSPRRDDNSESIIHQDHQPLVQEEKREDDESEGDQGRGMEGWRGDDNWGVLLKKGLKEEQRTRKREEAVWKRSEEAKLGDGGRAGEQDVPRSNEKTRPLVLLEDMCCWCTTCKFSQDERKRNKALDKINSTAGKQTFMLI